MKLRIKTILLTMLVLATLGVATGCGNEVTPYETNDAENYTVSVKYDANGGVFTTNTSVIMDSYNVADVNKNSDGMAEIALLSPDNSARGNDAFTAVKNGYFLAGWYSERTEIGTDEDGNTTYSYGNKWDFEKGLLEVDTSKTYTSAEPVITLYAAWVPLFEIEFYSLETGEYVDSMTYDPTVLTEIKVPTWSQETGAVEMYNFPERSGYTFNGVYFDEKGAEAVKTETLAHSGSVDYETGTAKDSVMKLYVDYMEGEWYHIYNVEQFVDNASINGNYEIHVDLDFADETWPTSLMYGNFTGSIKGNGHTFKNIEVTQTNNSKTNAGLFGALTETASVCDVTFENVTFTIEKGSRVNGTNYGLFAGAISDTAVVSNVQILGSTLQIDSGCYFGVDDYSIGLVCGMGNANVVPNAVINCVAIGDTPENVKITVEGNEVTVEFLTQ